MLGVASNRIFTGNPTLQGVIMGEPYHYPTGNRTDKGSVSVGIRSLSVPLKMRRALVKSVAIAATAHESPPRYGSG